MSDIILPEGFAELSGRSTNFLVEHFRISRNTVKKYLRALGIDPENRQAIAHASARRDMPADFAETFAKLGATKTRAHYACGSATFRRWCDEAGVERATPAERMPAPKAIRRPIARKASTWGGAPLRVGVTSTLDYSGMAARHLQSRYAPVYHRGRENPAERGMWQVGPKVLPEPDMIALARSKGWQA